MANPIMKIIFNEIPNSYELGYGLPGHCFLENKRSNDRRIYGCGTNHYNKMFYNNIIKKSRQDAIDQKGYAGQQENENRENNLIKHYFDGKMYKRNRHSALDLIL